MQDWSRPVGLLRHTQQDRWRKPPRSREWYNATDLEKRHLWEQY
jgi:hypothetical protein